MKAIVCTQYGPPDVLKYAEVAAPVPGDSEVLVKIHVASVTAADTMMRKGIPFYARLFLGLMRPKTPIPGTGFAGVILYECVPNIHDICLLISGIQAVCKLTPNDRMRRILDS